MSSVLLAILLKALYDAYGDCKEDQIPESVIIHRPTVSCIFQTALVRQLGEPTFGTVVFRLPHNLHHVIASVYAAMAALGMVALENRMLSGKLKLPLLNFNNIILLMYLQFAKVSHINHNNCYYIENNYC